MKIAQSLDAKIALSNGESKWITSKKSRDDVQQIRLACDAILVGSGTILKDNPRLDVRKNIRNLNERQPKKIVLGSSFLKRQNDIKILKGTAEVIVFSKEFSSYAKEGNLIQIPIKKSTTLQDTLKELGKHELNSILVEGGSKIFTSFIQEDLVDELILYISPKILGKESIDSISIESPIILRGAKKFKIYDSMLVGDDIKIIMRKKNKYK
jgi:riboflavin-specific deaminase-like protein